MIEEKTVSIAFLSGCEKDTDFPNVERENTSYHSYDFQVFENIFMGITTIVIFTTNILLTMVLATCKHLRQVFSFQSLSSNKGFKQYLLQ